METTDIFQYRQATADDVQVLKRLGLVSYGLYAETLGPANWEKLRAGVSDEARWHELVLKARSFVCVHNGLLIGMAFIMPSGHPWDIFEAGWSYIRMVGVDPDYQGRGLAKALTSQCIQHATATGEKVIALHTSEFMPAARHVYESFGFSIVREIEPRFGKRYWLYTLNL